MWVDWFRRIFFPHPLYMVRKVVDRLHHYRLEEFGDRAKTYELCMVTDDPTFILDPSRTGAIAIGEELENPVLHGDLTSYLAHTGTFPGLWLKPIHGSPILYPNNGQATLVFALAKTLEISLEDAAWLALPESYWGTDDGYMRMYTIKKRVDFLIEKYG